MEKSCVKNSFLYVPREGDISVAWAAPCIFIKQRYIYEVMPDFNLFLAADIDLQCLWMSRLYSSSHRSCCPLLRMKTVLHVVFVVWAVVFQYVVLKRHGVWARLQFPSSAATGRVGFRWNVVRKLQAGNNCHTEQEESSYRASSINMRHHGVRVRQSTRF